MNRRYAEAARLRDAQAEFLARREAAHAWIAEADLGALEAEMHDCAERNIVHYLRNERASEFGNLRALFSRLRVYQAASIMGGASG